mgnify:CR=1 FL=1
MSALVRHRFPSEHVAEHIHVHYVSSNFLEQVISTASIVSRTLNRYKYRIPTKRLLNFFAFKGLTDLLKLFLKSGEFS